MPVSSGPEHSRWPPKSTTSPGFEEEAAEDPALEFLDRSAVQREVASPAYLAGLRDRPRDGAGAPGQRLAWGLRDACLSAGVDIHEHTPVRSVAGRAGLMALRTDFGSVAAQRVALATNAFPSLLARPGCTPSRCTTTP